MSPLSRSPQVRKAALMRLSPTASDRSRAVVFPFNPEQLNHRLRSRSEGPPTQTFTLTLRLDATDILEDPDRDPEAARSGVAPTLAALESFLEADERRRPPTFWERLFGGSGSDPSPPVLLLMWGEQRQQPVRLVQMRVREEAFMPDLVPIRARVDLTMVAVSAADLDGHRIGREALTRHTAARGALAERGFSRDVPD